MRALIASLVVVSVMAGCGVRPCKKGTVLLTVKLDASLSAVDTFDVALSLAGGQAQHAFVNKKPGTSEGTIEVDFAQGYVPGAQPPCGPQACDGVTTGSCTWPTVACGQASCAAGVATAAAMCSAGMCPAPTTKTCPSGICGATDCVTVTQIAAGDAHTCAVLSD